MIVLCMSGIKSGQGRVNDTDRKIEILTQDAAIIIKRRLNFIGSVFDHRIVCNSLMLEKGWRTIYFDVPMDGVAERAKTALDKGLLARAQEILPDARVSVVFH